MKILAPLLLMLAFILVVAFMPLLAKPRPSVAGRGDVPDRTLAEKLARP